MNKIIPKEVLGEYKPKNTITISAGADVSVTKKHTTNLGFYRIGNGSKKDMTTIDLLALTETMTKRELAVMNLIKDNFIWNKDLDTSQKYTDGTSLITEPIIIAKGISVRTFQKGLADLKKKNLAKKVSNTIYMFNPLAIIPTKPKTAKQLWDSI